MTGSWVVPDVVAGSSAATYSSTWLGLDGYADNTVEQIGTEQDWVNGSAQYYAWFEMFPKVGYEISGFPVNPGDTIVAVVQSGPKGAFTLRITNETETDPNGDPISFSTTIVSRSAKRLSAEWIEEAPWSGGVLPLADFGTVSFTGCTATMNGHTGAINDSNWSYDAITMQRADGTDKAAPSDLTPGGGGFTITWYNE